MSTSEPRPGEKVKDVRFSDDQLIVDLFDGRTISVPLAWYPRLLQATQEQRENWELCGAGFGIHWPDIDEDLSTEGLLRGAPDMDDPDAGIEYDRESRLAYPPAKIEVLGVEKKGLVQIAHRVENATGHQHDGAYHAFHRPGCLPGIHIPIPTWIAVKEVFTG